eukprot:scaffold61396_cov63-Phaeocystis_antarctica.AAC.2
MRDGGGVATAPASARCAVASGGGDAGAGDCSPQSRGRSGTPLRRSASGSELLARAIRLLGAEARAAEARCRRACAPTAIYLPPQPSCAAAARGSCGSREKAPRAVCVKANVFRCFPPS